MKSGAKIPQKSPYNNPPVKLRAQIIPEKIVAKKPPSPKSSSEESSSDSSSYDSQVEDFANEFYDEEVKNADQSLQENKDRNQSEKQQGENEGKKQISKEGKKGKKALSQWDLISSRLKQLKPNFTDLDMDLLMFKKKDENKLKQIAQFLSKKHNQKRQFMKKLKKIKNSEKQRRKIEQEMQKKKQKDEHEQRLKQIRTISQMIKEKIQKKKEEQEDRLEDIEAFYEQFHKKYRNRKLYQLMENSDKKKRHLELEQQQEYLKQRRNFVSQVISPQDIIEFNKRRQQYLKDSHKVKQTQKDQKTNEIVIKNKELRDKIYLSNKYLEMQEQNARKGRAKQAPKQKIDRIKKYNSHIKEHFMPQKKNEDGEEDDAGKNQQPPDEEIVEIDGKPYRRAKKDRYIKGLKVGEITVNIPIPKTQKQQQMVGNSYLQQLKLLPKKRHSTSLDLSHQSAPFSPLKPTTPRPSIPKMQKKLGKINLSKHASRHEIENLISSLKAKDELISRQQHYLNAVKKGVENKEDLDDNLIDNIEKKINLLGRL